MKKYLFVTKNVSRKTNANKNDKGKSTRKFQVEKTKDKKYNDIFEINDDNNENQKNDLSNENYTIELSGDEENKLNNEADNIITTFINTQKSKYPLSYHIIEPDNNLSKYNIYNKNDN